MEKLDKTKEQVLQHLFPLFSPRESLTTESRKLQFNVQITTGPFFSK